MLDKDGANDYCLLIDKKLNLLIEPGATFKSLSTGALTCVQITAPITHEGYLTVDADYKSNFAIYVKEGAKGLVLSQWVGKNTTQIRSAIASAPIVINGESGVSFIECRALNSIGVSNGIPGDTPGAARGVLIFGTAPSFGINRVHGCIIDSVTNTVGISGAWEDEDGIESAMTGGYTVVSNNTFTNCMKRGVKISNAGEVFNNIILSARTSATWSDNINMYAGVSVYADNVQVYGNKCLSQNLVVGSVPGSFTYGVEIGVSFQARDNVQCFDNECAIGPGANGTVFYGVYVYGALTRGRIANNIIKADASLVGSHVAAFGVALALNHASIVSSIDVCENTTTGLINGVRLEGGFTGQIADNRIQNPSAEGIYITTNTPGLGTTLNPSYVSILDNKGSGMVSNLVRVANISTTNVLINGSMSDAASVPPVLSVVRYSEIASIAYARNVVFYGSVPPTTGTFVRGDRLLNIDPRDASPVVQWQCQYGGTPGTWRPSQWMVLKNTTANRPTLTTADVGVTYLDTTLAANGYPITWNGFTWSNYLGTAV
jgi:hypothetical protein